MSNFLPWTELKPGGTYFLLGYHDRARQFPYIETLIYIGRESSSVDEVLHNFAYAGPNSVPGSTAVLKDDETINFLDSDPPCLGDLEGLIGELQSLRVRKAGS